MKKFILSVLCLICLSLQAVNYCATQSWGYAGTNVTGGGSATPTLVSNINELTSAIGGKTPKNKVVIITKDITFTSMLTMQDAQNVTIMALPGVTLKSDQLNKDHSGILFVKRSSNIIIRNLTFIGPGAYDINGNDNLCFEDVTNAWVDHCDFQDGMDGNFDNKSGTDNVTVSWCRFRYLKAPIPGGSGGANDHRFTNLLGSSATDKPSDGTYNFTWAYCWWDEGCKERMVRCRNAELHFLNCYWNSSVANYYVGPENAACYFEGCTFEGAPKTSKIFYQNYEGTNACKFVNCTATKGLPSNSGSVSAPSYSYDKLSAAEAKEMVVNETCGAGAMLLVDTQGKVSSSCDSTTTDPEDPDPITGDLTWNFSTSDFNGLGDITSSTIVNGLTITATAAKKVTIASLPNAVEVDGQKFTHVLKTGGTGNKDYRSLSFAVMGDCTIDIYLISANADYTRTLNIYTGSYEGTPAKTMTAELTGTRQTFNYAGPATTIFLGSANSGINFYGINVAYAGGDIETGVERIQDSGLRIQKMVRDGQVMIERDGKTYTIIGTRVR